MRQKFKDGNAKLGHWRSECEVDVGESRVRGGSARGATGRFRLVAAIYALKSESVTIILSVALSYCHPSSSPFWPATILVCPYR
jgi:hypothetical protein